MADETQTQDTTAEAGGLAALPSGKGINIAGQKGVNLGAEQSSAIRDRLMQMIAEREGYDTSWKRIGDLGALAAAPIGGYSAAYDQYSARQRQREKDLIELQMGVGQLDTQQAQLKQQAEDNKFYADMLARLSGQQKPQAGGLPAAGQQQPQPPVDGVGPMQPQAGGLPAAQVQGAPGALPGGQPAPQPVLTPEQAMVLSGPAYRSNPLERSKELARMINQNQKPTDLEQEVRRMFPNDPEAQRKALAAVRLGPAFQETSVTETEGPGAGYKKPTTSYDVVNKRLTLGGAQTPPAAPAPTTPTAKVPGPAAAPSAAVVNPTASPNIGAGDGAGAINVRNPHPVGSPEYVKFREDLAKKEMEVQGAATMEEQKVTAKARGEEQTSLDAAVSAAGDDLIRATRIKENVTKFPDVVNKLNDSTVSSILMNIAQQGIQTPYGSISVPSVNEVATQLAGNMQGLTKEQRDARMSASQQIARDFATLALRASNIARGQGAVSDNERRLFAQIAGDYTRLTPQNVKYVAKAIEIEAHNARERKNLWSEMKSQGLSWEKFKESPRYQRMVEQQYYRSAKALGVKDPAPFNPAQEGGSGGRREEAKSLFR